MCEPIWIGGGRVVMRHVAGRVCEWSRLIGGSVFLALGAGCYNAPENSSGIHGATTQVAGIGTGHDSYIYYPAYGVYYNTTRHQYVYREGRSWVNRSNLPPAWARNLASTPEVAVDFHDAPEKHHAVVAQNYPANWRPGSSRVPANEAAR